MQLANTLVMAAGGPMYGTIGVSGTPARGPVGHAGHECGQKGTDAIRKALEFAQ